MDIETHTVMDDAFDSLETAFSNESRRVVRQIKIEWQKIAKYREDLSSKEDELFSAKEKLMHLNQMKEENEKYLRAAENRIENLKQSNIQLKSKLSHLEKEEERKTKMYAADQEYMATKLSLFKEKWRQRYEAYYSKNPKIQEKERALKEAEEIREKLSHVNVELQKCEKELFQAKCERNKRTIEESRFYPFNTFVINIAKVYFATMKEYEECKILSEEIALMEKNIAVQKARKLSEDVAFKEKNIVAQKAKELPEEFTLMERNVVAQKDLAKHSVTGKIPNIQEVGLVSSEKYNSIVRKDSTSVVKGSSFNAMMSEMKIYGKDEKAKPQKENYDTVSEKKIFHETKVQKWMEKFKVFVPKFSVSSTTESEKPDIETKRIEVDDTQFLRKYATTNYARQSVHEEQNKLFSEPEAMDVDITKNDDSMHFIKQTEQINAVTNDLSQKNMLFPKECPKNNPLEVKMAQVNDLYEQKTSNKSTSKYFQRYCQNSMLDDQMEVNEKATTVNPVVRENIQPEVCHDAMEVDEIICETDSNRNEEKYDEGIHIQEKCNKEIHSQEKYNKEIHTQEKYKKEIDSQKEYNTEEKELDIEQHKISEPIHTTPDNRETISNTATNDDNIIVLSNSRQNNDNEQIKNAFEDITVSDVQTYTVENKGIPAEVISNMPKVETMKATMVNEVTQIPSQIKNSDFTSTMTSESEQLYHIENKNSTSDILNVAVSCLNDNQVLSQSKTSAVNSSSQSYHTAICTPKSMDSIPKSTDSIPKSIDSIPKSMEYIPKSMDSSSKTAPQPRSLQGSAEGNKGIESSSFPPFNIEDSKSPGFTYVTRLMYQANTQNVTADAQNITRDLQNNLFAPISYFNCNNPDQSNKSDEDKNEFLTSAFEEYLNDSPPMMKQGMEKSMFAFVDSPETEDGPGGFFPLFAADNAESNTDSKDDTAPFMLNFGASSSAKSPDPNPGFKFLF